jgi:hypothetical protein
MPMPDLAPQHISWASEQVAAYIEKQRKIHRPQAAPLSSQQRATMQPFFPASVLDAARLLTLTDHHLPNPDFYSMLAAMGIESKYLPDFSDGIAAITFQDVIISYEPFTDQLLFHELVHAVQYQKLGLDEFAERYVNGFLQGGGYDGVPLEINAYQLDERFAKDPEQKFSVEIEVQKWIDAGKF